MEAKRHLVFDETALFFDGEVRKISTWCIYLFCRRVDAPLSKMIYLILVCGVVACLDCCFSLFYSVDICVCDQSIGMCLTSMFYHFFVMKLTGR